MTKTLYNPDRSTFKQKFSNVEYEVPKGESTFPDAVADHLAESLKMWGVRIVKDPSDITKAEDFHKLALFAHYKSVIESFTRQHKDLIAAGVTPPDTEEVKEARDYFAKLNG